MESKQGNVKVWLIPVLFAIALCMSAFAFLLPLTAKAEETTTTYDVTGITIANVAGDANNIYVDATVSSDVHKGWDTHYVGNGVVNGTTAVSVGFRVLPDTSTGWFVDTGVTNAGDTLTVSGAFTVDPNKTSYTGTLYPLNIEETTFKFTGSGWEVVSVSYDVTEIAIAGVTGDANNIYIDANISSDVHKGWDTHYVGNGVVNGTTAVSVGFRVLPDTSTGWFVDTGVSNAGDTLTVSGTFTVDPAKTTYTGTLYPLNIEETTFKFTGSGWELVVIKDVVDEMPEENIFLDANGADVWLTGNDVAVQDNTINNNWWGFFTPSAENVKVSFRNSAITDGGTLQINLGKKYKASNFVTVNVKILVGVAAGVTNTAYATEDTAFATPAGAASTTGETEAITLEIDASKIADSEGYIDSFVIRRTGSAGQMFVDYVELVIDKKDDTAYAKDLVLGINGSDATFSNGYHTADANGFWDEARQKVIGVKDNTGNNTVMTFTLAKKYKATNFESVTIEYLVSDWTSADNKITITAYALSDTDCVTPLASHTVNGSANTNDALTIAAEALAGSDGYIKGIILKKTQTVNEGSCAWQFFANEITLNVPSYTMTITDGDNTVTQRVVKGEAFAVADIGAENSQTQIVAGYKINDKLYSADYSFTPSADTAIEVIRVAFKVKDGGAIKYIGDMGLRFTALLDESEYNALKAIVSEGSVSFGMDLTKVATNKTVSKIATNYYTNEDGEISYNGVILNIPTTAYEEEFTANAYLEIKYEDKESAVKIYAIANDNTRSVYLVAKNALEKGVTGQIKTVCEEIVSTVEASKTNLPDYDAKKKCLN